MAAVLAPSLAAAVGELPLLQPTRDVSVVYRTTSDTPIGGVPAPHPDKIAFAYSAALGRMRIDAGSDDYAIVDRRADRTYVVLRKHRSYIVERAISAATPAFLLRETGRFVRAGEDIVAGFPCTVWQIDNQGWKATACVSGDGVLLRHIDKGTGFGTTTIEAISVVYAAQPDVLFEPPAGFRRLN